MKQHVELKCSNVLKSVAQILIAAVRVIEQVSFVMTHALVTLVKKLLDFKNSEATTLLFQIVHLAANNARTQFANHNWL